MSEQQTTARVALYLQRYDTGRIVCSISCGVGEERVAVSEEFGPFDTIQEVLVLADAFMRGYFQGQFVEVLLQDFSGCHLTQNG